MATMTSTVLILSNIIIIMMNFDPIEGINESSECSDQEHSPLCFCHSLSTDVFLAKLSLSQCNNSLSTRHCHQSRFHPPSFHLTQLIPQLTNLSYCFKDIHCLHTLRSTEYCQRCQLTSLLLTHNSYRSNACFDLCKHNTSCGFLCINQPVIVSIDCKICWRRQNISCRCIKTNQSSSCLQSSFETTTQRWMQKDGFPAAGILVLIILAVTLLVIIIKLIYRQLDILDKRHSISLHHSILLNQSQEPSPTHLNIPQILHTQSQELFAKIHRYDEENELSILLLEKS